MSPITHLMSLSLAVSSYSTLRSCTLLAIGWQGTERMKANADSGFVVVPTHSVQLIKKISSKNCGIMMGRRLKAGHVDGCNPPSVNEDEMKWVQSVVVEEITKEINKEISNQSSSNQTNESNKTPHENISDNIDGNYASNDKSPILAALKRAAEIGRVLGGSVFAPILISLAIRQNWPTQDNGGWEAFWSTCTPTLSPTTSSSSVQQISHAQRLVVALEQLGPTYVKFGQALGSRPDIIPPSLASALSNLQDQMIPFQTEMARNILRRELLDLRDDGGQIKVKELEELLASLSEEPVAAASIGQVYKGHLSGKGDVAVKVQRPGIRLLVERDTELLLTVATFLESLPALQPLDYDRNQPSSDESSTTKSNKPSRLINTELVSATKEFMSRIFEELDYRREAQNCITFANLYSRRNYHGRDASKDGYMSHTNYQNMDEKISVPLIVPVIYEEWCTENVLVMEWIDGTKLTDVQKNNAVAAAGDADIEDTIKENLNLVKVAIDSTLNQLLVTGVLHADPHAGNLLKIRLPDNTVTLGYLDFGLISTIPAQVRDALVCSVALQVFSRDVDAVANLFGELQLLPQHVLEDKAEKMALTEALEITFRNSMFYPDTSSSTLPLSSSKEIEEVTAIPELKFDKLLDSLSRLVPRFQFDLPPYFINNARALSTLEGIAKSLDPSFNVLTIMYPYALNRLLQNPSKSVVVESTLQSLIRTNNAIDYEKIRRLLRDSALMSGLSKRRVIWDVMKKKEGRTLVFDIIWEEAGNVIKMRMSRGQKKRKSKKWYYFEL